MHPREKQTKENILLLGTSHIAQESIDAVEKMITQQSPTIVALELDRQRYTSIQQEKKRKPRWRDMRQVGVRGYLFSIIGAWVEKKLGETVGTKPGAEMLKAIELCKQKNIRIALIDQDINITLEKISRAITWKDKWQFCKDILRAFFFRKQEIKRLGIEGIDLRKVPEKALMKRMMSDVAQRYPALYHVLVTERNHVMAERLHKLSEAFPEQKILAIVGAGHVDEIKRILEELSEKK